MTKQPGAIIALICKMALMTVVEEMLGIRWGEVKRKGGDATNCVGLLIFN